MISQIKNLEWIEVGSDLEAVMLETNLIKEYRPKYNVLMKDDKNYVYIKITKEPFPRIKLVRKVMKDGARYFGPKTAAHKCKQTLKMLQKLFNYRSCDLGLEWHGEKVKVTKKTIAFPCLDYHIKRCAGPCISEVTPEEYKKNINEIIKFLEGKTEAIEARLKEEMQVCVKEKNFEKAAQLRDQLLTIEDLMKGQLVTSEKLETMDVIGFVLNEGKAYFNLFRIREGKLIDQENFVAEANGFLAGDEAMAPEVLETFLFEYYKKAANTPGLILVPTEITEDEFFTDWLSQDCGHKVKLRVPERGKKDKLIELAQKNAQSFFKQHRARWAGFGDREDSLKELQKALKLEKLPKRIECYDISHLGGTDTVASMVVFENGKAKNADYRKFKLKTIEEGEIDDFKSMNEVLGRRLAYLSTSPGGFTVKKCTKKALKSLNQLLEEWNQSVAEDPATWSIALDENEVVGALRVMEGKDQRIALQALYVKEEHRNKGLAKAMFQFTIKKYKAKRVYVAAPLEKEKFYEHLGFESIKSFPNDFEEITKAAKERGDFSILALSPGKQSDDSFKSKPNLIVIDGGKGQLNKAIEARNHYGLDIPMIGLAKREEDVYLEGQSLPLLLPADSASIRILKQLRDEAHRFAISFQRKKRKAHLTQSALDDVPGMGSKNKMKLLRHFGSVAQIQKASDEAIEKIVGLSLTQAIRESIPREANS
mgnify:CR=1 FL=1